MLFGIAHLRTTGFVCARRHPGLVFRGAAPRRHTFRLAAHPVRHIGNLLARAFAGAARQQHAAEAEQEPFQSQSRVIHCGVMPVQCGKRRA